MPSYSYECEVCARDNQDVAEFLTYYSITADDEAKLEATTCPTCGSTNTRQVFSAPYVRVKQGSGNWEEYHQKNKGAMARDRDLHTLKSGDDPFAAHRTPGETEEKIEKLENSKKAIPKRQYFT